jgi:hypothetical protein
VHGFAYLPRRTQRRPGILTASNKYTFKIMMTKSTIKDDKKDWDNDGSEKDGNANIEAIRHQSVQLPAGRLWDDKSLNGEEDEENEVTKALPYSGKSRHKRVLILCTGGTLTMSADPLKGNSLAPVQGALTEYLASMREFIEDPEMPEIVAHEYRYDCF